MAGTRQRRGRRGIIGGYWGGYNSLSSSPTPRALPGKVENLTPPAAGQKRTGWSTASAGRAMLERCQLEPLRPDQCRHQQPGTGTGSRPRRPRYAPGRTRRSRSHRQCRQKARAAAHHAPPPWPFSFALPSRLPGLPDQQPGTRWVLCRPGEKLESARGALDTVHGYCAHRLHREGSAPTAPHQMTTPAADRRTR